MTEVAVVTGAGSGIGTAVAQRLAGNGYRVALCGRRPDRLDEVRDVLAGDGHTSHPGDLAKARVVGTVADGIAAEHGRVDALVHCAGGLIGSTGSDLVGLEQEMVATFGSNVLTATLLTHALLPAMSDNRGRIVAIGSIAGLRGGGVAYATAKAALHGWAFTVAATAGRRGITVNVVAPGYVTDTEFFGEAMTSERHERLVSQTLTGRPGRPEDVAATVEFLVSRDASHLTAQVVQVNGGALPR